MFAAHQILEAIALANHVHVGAIDQDLRRARAAVVVRRHHEAVRARAHHGEQVAVRRLGHLTLAREEIAALAYRPHHVGGHDLAAPARRSTGRISMVGLVEHRPNQIVHRAVDHDEALHVGFLDVEHARHQHAGVADHHAARLGDYLEPEARDRLQQRVRVFRGRRRLLPGRGCRDRRRDRDTCSAIPALRSRPTIAATFFARFGKWRHLGYLRSDMRAEPDDFELRRARSLRRSIRRPARAVRRTCCRDGRWKCADACPGRDRD